MSKYYINKYNIHVINSQYIYTYGDIYISNTHTYTSTYTHFIFPCLHRKLQRYSPSEPVKVWDKPLHRKISKTPFRPPDSVLIRISDSTNLVQRCNDFGEDAIKTRKSLINEYLNVS